MQGNLLPTKRENWMACQITKNIAGKIKSACPKDKPCVLYFLNSREANNLGGNTKWVF